MNTIFVGLMTLMPAIVTFTIAFGFAGVGQAFVQPALSSLVNAVVSRPTAPGSTTRCREPRRSTTRCPGKSR